MLDSFFLFFIPVAAAVVACVTTGQCAVMTLIAVLIRVISILSICDVLFFLDFGPDLLGQPVVSC